MSNEGAMPDWIQSPFEALHAHVPFPKDFVGQIEIHVFKGGISNINVRQSFKETESR
ncbi:MAG: hypothetical protein ABIR36_14405 [Nitrospiraceae bacterium]